MRETNPGRDGRRTNVHARPATATATAQAVCHDCGSTTTWPPRSPRIAICVMRCVPSVSLSDTARAAAAFRRWKRADTPLGQPRPSSPLRSGPAAAARTVDATQHGSPTNAGSLDFVHRLPAILSVFTQILPPPMGNHAIRGRPNRRGAREAQTRAMKSPSGHRYAPRRWTVLMDSG